MTDKYLRCSEWLCRRREFIEEIEGLKEEILSLKEELAEKQREVSVASVFGQAAGAFPRDQVWLVNRDGTVAGKIVNLDLAAAEPKEGVEQDFNGEFLPAQKS